MWQCPNTRRWGWWGHLLLLLLSLLLHQLDQVILGGQPWELYHSTESRFWGLQHWQPSATCSYKMRQLLLLCRCDKVILLILLLVRILLVLVMEHLLLLVEHFVFRSETLLVIRQLLLIHVKLLRHGTEGLLLLVMPRPSMLKHLLLLICVLLKLVMNESWLWIPSSLEMVVMMVHVLWHALHTSSISTATAAEGAVRRLLPSSATAASPSSHHESLSHF